MSLVVVVAYRRIEHFAFFFFGRVGQVHHFPAEVNTRSTLLTVSSRVA
jgi:hypothetical protein